jgi:HicB family
MIPSSVMPGSFNHASFTSHIIEVSLVILTISEILEGMNSRSRNCKYSTHTKLLQNNFMAVLTVRMPDDRHLRLKALAASQGVSVNKMIEELTSGN